jgi:putative membrane protein
MSTQDFFHLFLLPANWNHLLNLLFLMTAIVYLALTGPWKKIFPHAEPVSGKTKGLFLLALLIYYFALGSPLALMAHELFSMHMLQMSLLYFVLPPLLLLGIPAYMWRPLLHLPLLHALGRFFTRPVFTLFFFNGVISLYHIPIVFDTIMRNHPLHYISHAILLFAAFCTWWPIACPVPEYDRVPSLHKLALIFGNGVLLTPACAMITFTDVILFKTYATMSPLIPVMSPLEDQQLGGVIMKIVQEIVYITAIGIVFLQWIRRERVQDTKELLAWNEREGQRK